MVIYYTSYLSYFHALDLGRNTKAPSQTLLGIRDRADGAGDRASPGTCGRQAVP
jgi:hypothetical protein